MKSDNFKSYLDSLLTLTRSIFQSEYNGVIMFGSSSLKKKYAATNNPVNFDNFYFNQMISRDQLLDDVIKEPWKIHSCSRNYEDNKARIEFLTDLNKDRPAGDCFYDPILYRNELLGFMAQVKPSHYDFTDKDFFIQKLVKSFFYSGLNYYSLKEKTDLLNHTEITYGINNFAYFYCWLNGAIDIPKKNNHRLIEDVFEVKKITEKTIFSHYMIQYFIYMDAHINGRINNRYPGDKCTFPIVKRIVRNEDNYIIKMFRKEQKESVPLLFLVTIEKEKENFNYSSFAFKHSLTEREQRVVRYIMRGFSNRHISESLSISEATVKKHLSNIFEKTGCENRTQIVLAVVNS